MLRNHLILAWRKLLRHRTYSFIQTTGLALAVAFCLLAYLFVAHENRYDQLPQAERLFVVKTAVGGLPNVAPKKKWYEFLEAAGSFEWLSSPLPLKIHLPAELPIVERVGHLNFWGDETLVRANGQMVKEKLATADFEVMQMLSFRFLGGSVATALDGPGKVVLTRDLALKLFGRTDVVGQPLTIQLMQGEPFVVSGVVEPLPPPTSLPARLFISHHNGFSRKWDVTLWDRTSTTLLEVAEGTHPDQLASGLATFTQKHQPEVNKIFNMIMMSNQDGTAIDPKTLTAQLKPIPFRDLHFTQGWPGSSRRVYGQLLAGIAGLVLLIASINYVVLALTGANARRAEVGLRKVVGAGRWQLVGQFYLEAGLLVAAALGLGVGLAWLLLPWFNQLSGLTLALGWAEVLGATVALVALGGATSLLTGGYPAWVLSSMRPVQALNGWQTYRFSPGLVKGLVVFQYSCSAFLLALAWVMGQQMQYLLTTNLGYDQTQLLRLKVKMGYQDTRGRQVFTALQQELTGHPGVASLTAMFQNFDNPFVMMGLDTNQFFHPIFGVEGGFLPTLGIKLVEGRDFDRHRPADTTKVVIVNEAMVKRLGLQPPYVGQTVKLWHTRYLHGPVQIIGVVKNFHYGSRENEAMPVTLELLPEASNRIGEVIVRLRPGQTGAVMAQLQKRWSQLAPDLPFEYKFQDQAVAAQYEGYQRWTRIFQGAGALALLVACLGLYALAGLVASNRTKEMGIRKVFGASVGQLLALLHRDVVRLAVVSLVVALPLAWYTAQSWLENFAYRISGSGWAMAAVAGCLLASALLAVAHHTWRAARTNPVRNLRHE
jgi:putative ABC transport system permease protein